SPIAPRSPAVARTTPSTTTATVTATREAPTRSVGATSTAVVTGEDASTRSRSRSTSSTRPRSGRRPSWRSSATSTRAPTLTALLHRPPTTTTRRRRSGTRKPLASSAFAWRPVGARVFAPWRAKPMVHECNTRFIKGHKPSNHIRARIKSHVYTTECTVYHSTYHVKRYNKANTNVIYYINEKMSDTAEAKYKYEKELSEAEQGATGTSTGRRTPRSPCSPGSAERTPSRRQELSSSSVSERKK